MIINKKEVKHIVIRASDGNDIIYIGEDKIIKQNKNFSIHIMDENHNEIKIGVE